MKTWADGLGKFRRRVRIARAWRGLAIGGAAGAALCAIWAGLDYFKVFYTEWAWMGILVGATALAGIVVGFLLPVRDQALGDSIDRRAELKNRLGTALLGSAGDAEFVEAQRADAREHFETLKPAKVYPLKFARPHWLLGGLCGLAALLFILGNSSVLLSKDKQRERKELKEAAERIERVAKPVLEQDDGTTPEAKSVANDLKKLARELRKGGVGKEDALQKADELAKKADELSRKKYTEADNLVNDAETAYDKAIKDELAQKGLEGADPSMMQNSEAQNNEARKQLNQKIEDLKKKLENSQGKTQAVKDALKNQLDQAKRDLQKLELSEQARKTFEKLFAMKEFQDLRKLASQLKKATQSGKQGQDKLTPEQIKELQKKLEDLAKQLKDEKAMREYIEKLRAAMKKAEGG
jgi:hypothetical protein